MMNQARAGCIQIIGGTTEFTSDMSIEYGDEKEIRDSVFLWANTRL